MYRDTFQRSLDSGQMLCNSSISSRDKTDKSYTRGKAFSKGSSVNTESDSSGARDSLEKSGRLSRSQSEMSMGQDSKKQRLTRGRSTASIGMDDIKLSLYVRRADSQTDGNTRTPQKGEAAYKSGKSDHAAASGATQRRLRYKSGSRSDSGSTSGSMSGSISSSTGLDPAGDSHPPTNKPTPSSADVDTDGALHTSQDDSALDLPLAEDLSDQLGIIYDFPDTNEILQDDQGIMLFDDEEDYVFTNQRKSDVIAVSAVDDSGSNTYSSKVTLSTNVKVGWQDADRPASECVPDAEGLDGVLKESSEKMTKLLRDAEQAHQATSPDVEAAQAKVTLQAYGLKIGDKVMVGGVKTGVLRFCGPTEFATGIWAGIELDEAAGKNDGSVGGVSYFKCYPKHGIFAPVTKISRPGILVNRTGNTPRRAVNHGHVDTSKVTAKVDTGLHRTRSARSGGSSREAEELMDVGERVLVAGQRRGIIRFTGETDFAPGWWYGIELDRPVGKNDGSVNGKRYFTCKPKYGVFAPPSRIQKLSDLPDAGECLEAVAERQRRLSGSQPSLSSSTPKAKSSGPASYEYGSMSLLPKRVAPKSSGSLGTQRRPLSLSNSGGEFRLQEGTSVFCNNELGVIRYIGSVEFAEGIWLGVELRSAKGKNDGSVNGSRYFTCRANHGLLVRPSKVTVRGINGAKLMGGLDGSTEGGGGGGGEKKDGPY